MKSDHKRIGDFIRKVNDRNTELNVTNLMGINIDKFFMPSVANTVGTDMSKYRIVKRGQFACNRMHVGRDKRLPVALSKEEDIIVSPAYDVFEIINHEVLNPDYLMMWFLREEFDRNAWFFTDADVRGGLRWDDFCNIRIPVPSISKQKEIFKDYEILLNRVDLNNSIIRALEETAQAIFRQWFVDFDFPNETGMPYKSNGGEVKYDDELGKELPINWRKGTLNEIADIIDGDRGKNYPSQEDLKESDFCLFLNAGNVSKTGFNFSETAFISKEKDASLRKGKLVRNDVVITSRGTVGNVAFYSDNIPFNDIRINSGMLILRGKENAIFIYSLLRNKEMKKVIENYLSGSAQPQLPIKDLIKIPIVIPPNELLVEFSKIGIKIQSQIDLLNIKNLKIEELKGILLSKMATVEG
ncbi:restriction endonuclease subunit S [Cytobacillus gottheilii]|uniref:Restriction endonuclease subunit S n=1 Tax=Cytobacillus gottheilii TaxID=859144 RepID=A0ABX8FC47_9BACI|nr:restriction endonuclease subunit S [Cytobacillus gottheilii]QVY61948.1 restriction endonuclease subunit S [Cytobacillus gottheilii]